MIFVLVLCSKINIYAQIPFIRDFWLNEQYASVNVQSILQDNTGYILIGTDDGLFRFNGSDFSKIQGFNEAVSTLSSTESNLYIGNKKGSISQLTGQFKNKIQYLLKRNGSRIRCIASNLKGDTLWIGTETGIIAFSGGRQFIKLDNTKGLSDDFVYSICYLPNNRLIAATDNGINDIEFINGKPKITVLSTANGLTDNIVQIIKQVPDSKYYWVGMQQGGIALYNSESKTIHNFPESALWNYGQVTDILPVSHSKAWIITREGYLLEAELDNNLNLQIKGYHYPGHQFKKLICDRAGNLWCATKNGLSMITANYLSQIKLPDFYQLKKVTALCWADKNRLWLTQDSVLHEARINDSGSLLKPVFHPNALITCLYKDKHNRLWIGTMGKGLWYRNTEGVFKQDKTIASLANSNILSITTIEDKLWISTLTGVDEIYITDGQVPKLELLRHHNKQTGIGSDYVYYLYPDHLNRLWMATDGAGVCMFDGNQYFHWSNPENQQTKVAYSITEDANQNMWVGTYFKGLYHIKKGSNKFEMVEGLTDANLSTVTSNATGEVLTVYERCIDEWYPRSKQFRHFNFRMEVGIDSTSDVLNCFAKDNTGNIFIPYEHGILFFNNQYKQYDVRPEVAITSIATLSGKLSNNKNQFEADENYICIKYDGISFTNAERLQYRYRLLGFGDKWIITHDDAVTFSNLPPGTYTFQIQATINGSYELANGTFYTFTIKAPFWKSIWFYLLVLLFFALCVYAIIKIIGKRQKEKSQLQKERMEFEYEHLKSQVNPHFLFNSLNTLTNLIEEDQAAAVSYTERLADLYQNILAYRSRDLITLKEDLEILSTYLYVQNCRFGAALQVQYSIPEELMNTKKVVPMVLQMLVENAIKHNIVSLSQPLKITIMSDYTMLIVRNPLRPKMSKEKGAGIALLNIQKRYLLLTKKPVIFGIENNDYIVCLPLL
ncbi:hypothetical protein F0919_09570 [Taibaiella lutea]|uniref:Signal transduction histidine kinase internal region domain-containing protein n=1 Tax=Taibaiella lutea TaxID=2608001 RepID=A0A5M6CNI1_9BACT|nr:sensor histidine kinase [Taibaiella lutea]KAA5534845.1 hypothetical protein F0919_09570 [Taibaiella lutea]